MASQNQVRKDPIICPHCNVHQPLVVKKDCHSCGKPLNLKVPTAEDFRQYQKWLIQHEAKAIAARVT